MHTEVLTYQADGLPMRSELFLEPGAGRRPGIIVFPEAFGLVDHTRERARRLAAMGYVALAADLHGEARVEDDLQAAIGLLKPLYADPGKTRARARGAMDALAARDEVDGERLAAIGFCFGGTMALELARDGAPLRAVVGFHSGLGTTAAAVAPGSIQPRVLVCIGANDPMIDGAQRTAFEAEMRAAKADWQMHLYGGTVHSFTNKEAGKRGMPEAIRYSAAADAESWASMQALLMQCLAER